MNKCKFIKLFWILVAHVHYRPFLRNQDVHMHRAKHKILKKNDKHSSNQGFNQLRQRSILCGHCVNDDYNPPANARELPVYERVCKSQMTWPQYLTNAINLTYYLTGMVLDPVGHGSKWGAFLKYHIFAQKLSHTTSFWQNFESNPKLASRLFVPCIFIKYSNI